MSIWCCHILSLLENIIWKYLPSMVAFLSKIRLSFMIRLSLAAPVMEQVGNQLERWIITTWKKLVNGWFYQTLPCGIFSEFAVQKSPCESVNHPSFARSVAGMVAGMVVSLKITWKCRRFLCSLIAGWWFQTFFIFHNMWDNPSHWLSYFSRWLKPPTSHCVGFYFGYDITMLSSHQLV